MVRKTSATKSWELREYDQTSRFGHVLFLCLITFLQVSTVEAAVPDNVFSSLPSPDFSAGGWNLPPREYVIGLCVGLALALYSVYKFSQNASPTQALISGTGGSTSRYGHTRALLKNGFVWRYVVLIVGFAGLLYSGFFELLRDRVAESMPGVVGWAPAGASMLATFGLTLLARRFSWLRAEGGVELEGMIKNLEDESAIAGKRHWLSTLTWSSFEDERQQKVSDLAYSYSTGFIKFAVRKHCESAIDHGQLAAAEVSELLDELDSVPVGEDERQRFINRRRTIQISSRIVPLEDLKQTIQDSDRRKSERRSQRGKVPHDKERRRRAERRVDGALVGVSG
jgi:hypothetical protein